jgi:glutamate synthase domain-containing protein 3
MQAPTRVNPTEIDPKYQSRVKSEGKVVKVDAADMYYKDLNAILRAVIQQAELERIDILNVCGQRYIGTDLNTTIPIHIYGTPGNDLAAFGNGPQITVHGNGQDGSGNTMNEGQIVIEGHAGDVTGHSMRGGKIFVKDYVGYRTGIHMKEYEKKVPTIVIGDVAGDFLAEYMAGASSAYLASASKRARNALHASLAQACTAASSMNAENSSAQ